MRKRLTNAICGVVDYASYLAGMLLAAPISLRRPGASEYCLWPKRRQLNRGARGRSCMPPSLTIPYSVQGESKP